MIENKKNLFSFIFILGFFVFFFNSIILVNSVKCNYQPLSIKVFSGDEYVGDALFDNIFIKNSLGENPLKLEFYFENGVENCFNSKNDLELELLQGQNRIPATAFSTNNNDGIYRSLFIFDLSAQISFKNSFRSKYFVKNNQYVNSIRFNIDNKKPIFDLIEISPIKDLYKSGENISLKIRVVDTGSGLSKLVLKGLINENFDLEGNRSFLLEREITLNKEENLKIEVYDKSLNFNSKNFTFLIDNEPPKVVDNKLIDSYEFDYSSKKTYVTLKAVLEDKSFSFENNINNKVNFDLSQINPEFSSVGVSCEKVSENYFSCETPKIPISLNSTQNVNIKISVSDKLENFANYSFNKKIFVDNSPVDILEFNLINGIGKKGIFSGYDNNSYIYLRFKDESLSSEENKPTIKPDFGLLKNLVGSCEYDYIKKEGECKWPIKNYARLFLGKEEGVFVISVKIIDKYLNSREEFKEIKFYNKYPEIISVNLLEKNSIKDGVYSSGEEVDLLVRFKRNIGTLDDYKLVLNLSGITNNVNLNNKTPDRCRDYSDDMVECYFNNLVLRDGYVNTSIKGGLINYVGLKTKINKNIEILKISNEDRNDLVSGQTIDVLNPIERNSLKETDIDIWYKGGFKLNSNNSDIKIINFQLKNCEERGLNPLLFTSEGFGLYPDDVVFVNYSTNIDDVKFVLKSGIRRYDNFNDMNDKEFNCTFSVLKRDKTTIYKPEEVNYNFKVSFFNLPRGNIVKAYAKDLLDDISEVEETTNWFTSLYDIYSILSTMCTAFNGALKVMSLTSEAWTPVSYVLHSNPATINIAQAQDEATYNSQGWLSSLRDIIGPICSFVTCENGGLLGSVLKMSPSDIPGIGTVFEGLNKVNDIVSNSVCVAPVSAVMGVNDNGKKRGNKQ